jgi:hypothetical protein
VSEQFLAFLESPADFVHVTDDPLANRADCVGVLGQERDIELAFLNRF